MRTVVPFPILSPLPVLLRVMKCSSLSPNPLLPLSETCYKSPYTSFHLMCVLVKRKKKKRVLTQRAICTVVSMLSIPFPTPRFEEFGCSSCVCVCVDFSPSLPLSISFNFQHFYIYSIYSLLALLWFFILFPVDEYTIKLQWLFIPETNSYSSTSHSFSFGSNDSHNIGAGNMAGVPLYQLRPPVDFSLLRFYTCS